jgi:hypothetical protein
VAAPDTLFGTLPGLDMPIRTAAALDGRDDVPSNRAESDATGSGAGQDDDDHAAGGVPVMFFWFPSGPVLYWLVNNCYSIAQQWVITRRNRGRRRRRRARRRQKADPRPVACAASTG